MAWPLSSHFSTMLQTPNVAFRDPELKKSTIFRNAQGQPKPWAGAFAVVYKATLPSGENRAIRVFASESAERRERYELISEYLKGKHLDCLVHFEYVDSAIRSTDGKWYPLVTMDWVEGNTLFQWVDAQCKAQNAAALRIAADVWCSVVKEVEDAGISHGDYQQANIMVTPEGRMMLVDYDCMCVPALVGRRNLEIGVEPYQHPERNGQTLLSPTLDRFSALMIFTALRALAADLNLWKSFVTEPDYDKLMFRKEDIQRPNESRLIRELMSSPDPEVREYTTALIRAAMRPMVEVPSLREVTSPVRAIEPMLQAGQWKEAVDYLQANKITEIPPHLKELVETAYKEVWKEKAWAEFQTLPTEVNEKADRQIARVCNDAFLQEFPIEPAMRERVLAARARVILLDRLAQMVKFSKNSLILTGERSMAAVGDQLPCGYQYIHKPRVLQAKKTVEVLDALLVPLSNPEPNELEIDAAWMNIKRHKLFNLLKADQMERAELAHIRAPRIRILESFRKTTPLDQLDKQILALWDAKLFEKCPQALKYEKLYERALRRRVKLEMLMDAVKYGDEAQIATLLEDPLLKNYPFSGELGNMLKNRAEAYTHSQGMIEAMNANSAEEFIAQFDVNAIRANPDTYQEFYTAMQNWIIQLVLPRTVNGLKPAMGRASILPDEKSSNIQVRWTWMNPRFGDACVVGITAQNPLETDRPEDLNLLWSQEISRPEWEQMGSCLHLEQNPDWNGKNVLIWGVIDTGLSRLVTEPMVLGQLTIKKKSWFGWK